MVSHFPFRGVENQAHVFAGWDGGESDLGFVAVVDLKVELGVPLVAVALELGSLVLLFLENLLSGEDEIERGLAAELGADG